MNVKSYSVENERLGIDFDDEVRPVFIKGKTINGVFHVRIEDFETYPNLSDSDREDIRNFLRDSNVVID
jgi:hypothetical protein